MINCVMTIIVKVAVEPPAAGEGFQIRQFLSNSTNDSSAFSPWRRIVIIINLTEKIAWKLILLQLNVKGLQKLGPKL